MDLSFKDQAFLRKMILVSSYLDKILVSNTVSEI